MMMTTEGGNGGIKIVVGGGVGVGRRRRRRGWLSRRRATATANAIAIPPVVLRVHESLLATPLRRPFTSPHRRRPGGVIRRRRIDVFVEI